LNLKVEVRKSELRLTTLVVCYVW